MAAPLSALPWQNLIHTHSLLRHYFVTTLKEIGRSPRYQHLKSSFSLACTGTSCSVTTSTHIINTLDCTESEFGLKTMLCILKFAKPSHRLSRWHSFHRDRVEPRSRPLCNFQEPNLCSGMMGDIMEPLVLPEIRYKMKVLTTIANKKAFTPFVIGVSDSNKPKASTS